MLYVNDESLGEQCLGTREQFKAALSDLWPIWYAESEKDMTIDEFVDTVLDNALTEADQDDIERLTKLGMALD